MNGRVARRRTKYAEPVFQAFAVKTTSGAARAKLDKAIADELGDHWQVRNYGGRTNYFEVFAEEGALKAADAWDRTYRLRAYRGIASAEPVFKAWVTDRPDWGITGDGSLEAAAFGAADWFCGSGDDLAKAKPHEWSLAMTKVVQAWSHHFTDPSKPPGLDVVVGHPDTGYRKHPEIASSLLADQGFDLFRNDSDALDELRGGLPWRTPGHGTATASVIVSPQANAHNGVSGTAPFAKLIPYRVSDSVVVLDTLNLARAIEMAADRGAHVISMSMGGLGSDRLHDAVVYARNKGVIVLAAAGNCVRFVVFPAAYDEVVAVAACDAAGNPWSGSSRGHAVDITAPGDRVWHAKAHKNDNRADVTQGSGTSYAVATVAGIAALWLSKHGRNTVIQACGGREKIAPTFLQLLRSTAAPMPGWPTGQFGGGLVDADALLSAPLPNGRTVPTLAPTADEHAAVDRGGSRTFGHLYDAGDTVTTLDGLNAGLATVLNTTTDKVPVDLGQVGQELAFHLATDPALYRRFEAMLTATDRGLAATANSNADTIRDDLLAKSVSPALKAKLNG
ncbi:MULTISPECIES: S8 family serine peptidase [unclassified Kribbella]|uniref:S8 family peptidase n=1 Tax=unclassified Kribbella TaxID=2644121 RepID=UPI003405B7A0